MNITYQVEKDLDANEFRDVLVNSTLGERIPVNDITRLTSMCENANLIITARLTNKLIGVARSITDYSFCTYLSDLAVDLKYQRKGIGKRLIYETQVHSKEAGVILLSAPNAVDYYPKIGMQHFAHYFRIKEPSEIKINALDRCRPNYYPNSVHTFLYNHCK